MSKYTEEEWVALNNRTMKQTAVDWLESKLNEFEFDDALYIANNRGWFKQAKEMERKQIIDAHISGYDSSGGSAKDYYDFYYGSKGNDDTSSQTERMYSEKEVKSAFKKGFYRWNEPIEISDEEIENVAWEKYTGDSARLAWVEAIKWYKEQLKSRQ